MQVSFNNKLLIPMVAFIALIALSTIAYLNVPPKIIDLKTYENFLKNDLLLRQRLKIMKLSCIQKRIVTPS